MDNSDLLHLYWSSAEKWIHDHWFYGKLHCIKRPVKSISWYYAAAFLILKVGQIILLQAGAGALESAFYPQTRVRELSTMAHHEVKTVPTQ
jgi:hypothetical protein